MPSDLITTGRAAQMLGVSRQHVVDMCTRGDLRYVMVGKHRRVPTTEIEQLRTPELTREQEKSLWLHRAILGPLMSDPDLVLSGARSNIERWTKGHRSDGMARRYFERWQSVLDSGVDEVADVLTSTSPQACELRQNTPFAGVLTDEERARVLRSFTHHWRRDHEGRKAVAV